MNRGHELRTLGARDNVGEVNYYGAKSMDGTFHAILGVRCTWIVRQGKEGSVQRSSHLNHLPQRRGSFYSIIRIDSRHVGHILQQLRRGRVRGRHLDRYLVDRSPYVLRVLQIFAEVLRCVPGVDQECADTALQRALGVLQKDRLEIVRGAVDHKIVERYLDGKPEQQKRGDDSIGAPQEWVSATSVCKDIQHQGHQRENCGNEHEHSARRRQNGLRIRLVQLHHLCVILGLG